MPRYFHEVSGHSSQFLAFNLARDGYAQLRLEANHLVTAGNILGTVRHQNRSHRARAGRYIQVSHQRAGRLSVQVRGRLIQQQHRRVHQQGTSHRQTLTLTTRQEGAASTHRGAHT